MDWGKGTVRVDVDGVEGIGMEQSDKKWHLNLLEVDSSCDGPEKVGVNKFFPGVPNVVVLLINN